MNPLIIILALLISTPVLAKGNLRCKKGSGSVLVGVGDTFRDLVDVCGKPDSRERAGSVKVRIPIVRESGQKMVRITRVPVLKLRYNCGAGQFVRVVTLHGGVFKSAESLRERGSGYPVRCW